MKDTRLEPRKPPIAKLENRDVWKTSLTPTSTPAQLEDTTFGSRLPFKTHF